MLVKNTDPPSLVFYFFFNFVKKRPNYTEDNQIARNFQHKKWYGQRSLWHLFWCIGTHTEFSWDGAKKFLWTKFQSYKTKGSFERKFLSYRRKFLFDRMSCCRKMFLYRRETALCWWNIFFLNMEWQSTEGYKFYAFCL